jgi:hypothetical protein
VTEAEIKELEELFGCSEVNQPEDIIATMDSSDSKVSDFPKKTLKKINTTFRASEFFRSNTPSLFEPMSPYRDVDRNLIPKIQDRADNI